MNYSNDEYENFKERMHSRFPKIFELSYGGFAIGKGWWPIIESLCCQIQSYLDHKKKCRQHLLENNPHNYEIPKEIEQVVAHQIKEKFGGLRFYYGGGDDTIDGMVRMAEEWADNSCEKCGCPGIKRSGGWIKTLCDTHEKERQERLKKRYYEDTISF